MKNVNLRSAAERVLSRIKSMTNEELAVALESCADGPIGYAFTAYQSYLPEFSCKQVAVFYVNNRSLIKDIQFAEHVISSFDDLCKTDDAANDSLYLLAA